MRSKLQVIIDLITEMFSKPKQMPKPVPNPHPWMDICDSDLAIDWKEISGPDSNSYITGAFNLCGYEYASDEAAWCGVYVGSVLIMSGFKPPLEPAWARHYSDPNWGELLKAPRYGCIANIERNGPGGDSHVGFVVSFDNEHIRLHGGNQSGNVNRSLIIPIRDVISFKWPKERY